MRRNRRSSITSRLNITYMAKYLMWNPEIDLNDLLKMYIDIEEKQRSWPVTLELPAPPERQPVVDGGEQQRFFTPSLQQQRNSFVFGLLKYAEKRIEKLAILGCGELSFEKSYIKDISDRGIKHIVSIDVDEQPLSRGLRNMKGFLTHNDQFTVKRPYPPVFLEVYKGDIMTPSSVLSNVGVAVSTEVIEHMPLERATALLKCVLEKIRPSMYILSTPNFEYNVAFNRTAGFRHDDHHFEFTRAQFKNWLEENVKPPYTYEIFLIGRLEGYDHLEGATQFALITTIDDYLEFKEHGTVITENEGALEKVGEFVYRSSYYRLFEAIVVGAFRKFVDQFPFDHNELTSVSTLKLWRISIERILEFRMKPTIEIDEEDAMLMITRLFSTLCYNSQMPDTERAAISIPPSISKKMLIDAISKVFMCFEDEN